MIEPFDLLFFGLYIKDAPLRQATELSSPVFSASILLTSQLPHIVKFSLIPSGRQDRLGRTATYFLMAAVLNEFKTYNITPIIQKTGK
jgi:hypothetical protein